MKMIIKEVVLGSHLMNMI